MSHPIYKAQQEQTLLVGYATTVPVRVLDAEGAALPLDGAALTAEIDHAGRGTRAAPASVVVVDDVVLVRIAAADTQALAGRVGVLGVRLDLGAGVVYEVQAPVRGERGVAPPEPGSSYTTPGLDVTITGGEAPAVRAEWQAVRDLTAAIAAAEALQQDVAAALPQITEAVSGGLAQIGEARTGALNDIDQAGTAELTAIEQAGQDERAAIEQAGADAVQAVEEAETTRIDQATTEGVQAVKDQQTQSVQAVADRQTQAEGAVDTRRDQALSAIQLQEAQSEAAVLAQEIASVAAVVEEGDAQEARIVAEGNTQVGRVTEALGAMPSPVGQAAGRIVQTDGANGYALGLPLSLLAAQFATSTRVVAYDDFGRSDRSLDGDTMPSGQVWASGSKTEGRHIRVAGRAATSDNTITAERWAVYPEASPLRLYHRAGIGLRLGSSATALLILAWGAPDHYLAAGIHEGSASLQIILRTGATSAVLASASLGGTNIYGSLVGTLEAQIQAAHGSYRYIWASLRGVTVLLNTFGDADVDALLAASTHCGILLNRGDAIESYIAIRGPDN